MSRRSPGPVHAYQHKSIGSGTIAFGLVSVAVKVYSAADGEREVTAHQLHERCKARLKQTMTCSTCGEVVPRSETVKGYDVGGQVVILRDDEAKALMRDDGGAAIEITEAVPSIPPAYYAGSAYYLSPEEGFGRAYDLLAASLERAGLAAVARWTWRGKTRVVAIRPNEHGILTMQGLHYAGALRDSAPLVVERPEPSEAEVALGVQLISTIQANAYDPDSYTDDGTERLMAELQRRAAGAPALEAAPSRGPAEIIDIMTALKASLAAKAPALAS